jgi:hypothetical protein
MTHMADTTRGRIDGWGIYLLLLVCLIPVVVPSGPARLAFVDGLIVLGLGAFGIQFLAQRESIQIPYLGPVFMIAVGSIVAVSSALSPGLSFLAMAQDAYLFLWFIMLVHLLKDRDLIPIQRTWMWVGVAISLYGLFILMTEHHMGLLDMVKPRGRRELSTFYDPNMLAGYLVMSVFFVLSLGKRVSPLLKWGSIGIMMVGILASKSLGGNSSLMVGLAVWALMRARTRRSHPLLVAVAGLLAVCMALLTVWLTVGMGVGSAELSEFESHSFLARASHSSAGRFTIWKNLEDTYKRHPLGIGPGNSSSLTFKSAAQRLRPGSLQAKEAHNDYLAYAIERGPLGILGLLLMLGAAFGKLFAAARPPEGRAPPDDRLGPLVAAAAGALAASAVHGLTIEVLHFRHFWMLMAIICAIDLMAKGQRARGGVPAEHPSSGTPARVAAA